MQNECDALRFLHGMLQRLQQEHHRITTLQQDEELLARLSAGDETAVPPGVSIYHMLAALRHRITRKRMVKEQVDAAAALVAYAQASLLRLQRMNAVAGVYPSLLVFNATAHIVDSISALAVDEADAILHPPHQHGSV